MRPTVPQKTLAHLEWDRVLTRLSEHCRGPVASARARALPFADGEAERAVRLARNSEARNLIDDGRVPPLGNPPDVDRPVTIASRGGVLDAEDLIDIGSFLESAWRTRKALEDLPDLAPRLAALAAQLVSLPDLSRELRDAFDERGELQNSASGELGSLRTKVGTLHEHLKQSVHSLLADADYTDLLQDEYYTVRDDRYVLPIKSGHKRHVPGIVHGSSQSGHTVFIEPQAVVEANNRLVLAQAEVDREIRRILAKLSKSVGNRATEIRASQETLAAIDLAFAAGFLSKELKGTSPLAAKDAPLGLKAARHPLLVLAGIDVVPNDIRLLPEQRGLVITGPNTGGKTVALKTVGLCALMALAGLHIPADEGSTLPLWPAVHTDIGDEQSLDDHRSTFSGHIANLVSILDALQPGSLVLLDEIAVGTDPVQGAALAQAILEGLVDRGVMVMTTTHFESLKALPFEDPRFRNGAVGFDVEAGGPTYRLRMDVPGSSNALSTARRLGLDPAMVERALELAGGQHQRLEQVIARMEAEQALAHNARLAAEKEQRRLEIARTELEAAQARLRQQIKDGVARERDQALREAKSLREDLEKLRRQVRRDQNRNDPAWLASQQGRAQQAIEQVITARKADVAQGSGAPLRPESLRVGQRVWVLSLENEAEIVALPDDKGRVEVRAGIVTARVAQTDLRAAETRKADRKAGKRLREAGAAEAEAAAVESGFIPPDPAPVVGWDALPPQVPDNTCDVRGQRVDDAIENVERFLDTVYERDGRVAFIIHGHGTGVLKRQLRLWLQKCKYVRDQRPGLRHEGGDGVTAVMLG